MTLRRLRSAALLPFACLAWGVLCGLAASPRTARADGPDVNNDVRRNEARDHFQRGVQLLGERAWDPALAEFLESRRLYPTRSATQNAVICLKNLGRYDEAADLLVILEGFEMTDDERAAVRRERTELEARLGFARITVSEPGATVSVDGRERGLSPLDGPIRLTAGTHVIRAHESGFEPVERVITVAGDGRVDVFVKLVALAQSGRLTVTEEAGRPAEVIVDNVVVGRAPYQGSFAPGDHSIYLRGAGELGTQPALAPVRVNQVTTITLALEAIDSALHVTPDPRDATVVIDGVPVGHGAWDGRLRSGPHRVEVAQAGFVPQVRRVALTKGRTERVAVSLERDLTHPLWASANPNRVFGELALSAPLTLSPGGAAADCSGGCTRDFPWGASLAARLGYQLRFGLGVGIDASYSYGNFSTSGRATNLEVNGDLAGTPAVIDERLRYRALSLGASVHYQRGERVVLTGRLGSGIWTGSVSATRSGALVAGGPLPTVAEEPSMTALYVAPELRLGRRFAPRLELYLAVSATLLVRLGAPEFTGAQSFPISDKGFARYRREPLIGTVSLLAGPSVGVKYDF